MAGFGVRFASPRTSVSVIRTRFAVSRRRCHEPGVLFGRKGHRGGWVCRASENNGEQSETPKRRVGSVSVLLLSAGEFGVLSLDTRFRTLIDENVRNLVLASSSEEGRGVARAVSNVFPEFSLAFVGFATALLLIKGPVSVRPRLAISWATIGAAAIAVDVLKNHYQRTRPQLGLTSYAFPSGHTCATTVCCGLALFALLDPVTRSVFGNDDDDAEEKVQPTKKSTTAPHDTFVRIMWIAAIATTGTCRVLGNRHWVSDTAGGAALGTAFLAVALMAIETIEKQTESDASE